ncbi:MAG: NADH-quinone oxidoreductase subunit M [Deltaproteobacteria bacterium]|nr:NADH-quinone oxidoreductase subunit M [Deltaproteobacteria bacterium]
MEKLLLSLIVFLPIFGVAIILFLPAARLQLIRATATITCALVLALSVYLVYIFDPHAANTGTALGGFNKATLIELPWIKSFHIYYRLGIDGLAVSLVFLTALLSFLACFIAFPIKLQVKAFFVLYLLLVTGMMGVFMSLDFFLFYVFWEVMLLPMYFLIGIWGGERRAYAAIKFFIYTLLGSVLILVVILAYYFKMSALGLNEYAFNIPELIMRRPFDEHPTVGWLQIVLFFCLFIGFAIKIPVFPFHTWLPDAHVEAPTAISVILAGVLLKMGGYGILRINYPLLPEVASLSWVMYFMALLGVINIIYGAFCALGQTDFKRLVAYSSVSHMGYALLGIAVLSNEGVNGAVFQMFAHGISSAMMFMIVGVLYERAHHRDLNRFGGIARQMPNYFALAVVAFFSSLGLPALIGFIGEILVFLGVYRYSAELTGIALIGLLLTASYILLTMQRVYLGDPKEAHNSYRDCTVWEYCALVPLALSSIVFGCFPGLLLDLVKNSSAAFVKLFS